MWRSCLKPPGSLVSAIHDNDAHLIRLPQCHHIISDKCAIHQFALHYHHDLNLSGAVARTHGATGAVARKGGGKQFMFLTHFLPTTHLSEFYLCVSKFIFPNV